VYATADQPDGTTGELAVSVESDAQWNALVAVVDDASWHDPRLGTRADRAARFEDLDATLRAWCANQPLAATVDRLLAAGVPAAPVVGARVGDRNPQHEARRFYTPVEHSLAGVHAIPSVPWLLDGHDGPRVRGAAPLLGEHTRSVLGELLGLDDPALDALEADAIIGYRPIGQ
jgi:crotonobetainyl-CoA:carnitine CoA-transferase CaiB-like acyl-CoA transferase